MYKQSSVIKGHILVARALTSRTPKCAGLKGVNGVCSNAIGPVSAVDGTLMSKKSNIVQLWPDHVSKLASC